jgi:hypothetical protein
MKHLDIDSLERLFKRNWNAHPHYVILVDEYNEGELSERDSKRKIGGSDFSTKSTNFYTLDVIISVGYCGF